jgi:hypothetical protein
MKVPQNALAESQNKGVEHKVSETPQYGRATALREELTACNCGLDSIMQLGRVSLRGASAISEFGSSSSPIADPRIVRFSTTGANMVCRTKERALDPLLVPALLALATPSIC